MGGTRNYLICASALFVALSSAGANAQNCTPVNVTTPAPPGPFLPLTFNSVPYFGSGLAASQAIAGSVTACCLER